MHAVKFVRSFVRSFVPCVQGFPSAFCDFFYLTHRDGIADDQPTAAELEVGPGAAAVCKLSSSRPRLERESPTPISTFDCASDIAVLLNLNLLV